MATYRYRSWGGQTHTVEAASVEFLPRHVAFYDAAGRLVLAEAATNVNRLSRDDADGNASNRLPTPEETTP